MSSRCSISSLYLRRSAGRRREPTNWNLDFVWGFKGIERYIAEHGYTFKDHDGGQYETRKDIGIRITEPLSGKNHHYLDIYKLVKAEAGDEDTKQTIWGPAHAYTELAIFDR